MKIFKCILLLLIIGISGCSGCFSGGDNDIKTPTKYYVDWTDIIGVEANKRSVKALVDGKGKSGVASKDIIESHEDGYFEFVTNDNKTGKFIGFSKENVDSDFKSIDYTFYLRDDGNLMIFEKGVDVGSFDRYFKNDKLKIEKIGNVINYYRNSRLLYTSKLAKPESFVIDISFLHKNAQIITPIISFGKNEKNLIASTSAKGSSNANKKIVWKDDVGVEKSEDGLKGTKTKWGEAGACSANVLPKGASGKFEFVVPDVKSALVAGLSKRNQDNHYKSIHFGIYIAQGKAQIFENGNKINGVERVYKAGDTFSIERSNTKIIYSINGSQLYKSKQISVSALLVDVAIYTKGSAFTNAKVSFPVNGDDSADDTIASDELVMNKRAVWNDGKGIKIINNDVVATARKWGNAGVVSANFLPANSDGAFQFIIADPNTMMMVGLAEKNKELHFKSIDYAFYLEKGKLKLFEKGEEVMQNFGEYKIDDIAKIVRREGKVKYYINDVDIYTSKKTSLTDLYIDASFYDPGARLVDVRATFLPAQNFTPAYNLPQKHWVIEDGANGSLVVQNDGKQSEKKKEDTKKSQEKEDKETQNEKEDKADSQKVKKKDTRSPVKINSSGKFEPVQWASSNGLTIKGEQVINKNKEGWLSNTTAITKNQLDRDTEGEMQVVVTKGLAHMVVGLTETPEKNDFGNLTFAFHFLRNRKVRIYERGKKVDEFADYQDGSIFRIQRKGDEIIYLRHNRVLYKSKRKSKNYMKGQITVHDKAPFNCSIKTDF